MANSIDIPATIVFQKNWEAIHARNADGSRKYRYILNRGSSRSSKTYSLIDLCHLYAKDNRNKRLTIWRDTKTDCVKTIGNDFTRRMEQLGIHNKLYAWNKTTNYASYSNNSTVELHGTDDHITVHGLTQDVAWLNEPYYISEATFNQIDQRTGDFVIIDMNPLGNHWTDKFEKDPRAIIIHSTFLDNPFCPVEMRNKILAYQPVMMCRAVLNELLPLQTALCYDCAHNPSNLPNGINKELERCQFNEYKGTASEYDWAVYGLGLKAERPHRIHKFKKIPYAEYAKLQLPVYNGVDWGAVDPWAIGELKYMDGALYVHELNYESENELKERMNTTERSQVQGDEEGEGVVAWMFKRLGIPYDRLIVCDSNREAKIRALRRCGWDYAIAATKGPGSVKDGISLVNDLAVYYTDTSTNIEFEQENYVYKVDTAGTVLEEPMDINNHHMDWIRYVAMYLAAQGVIRGR